MKKKLFISLGLVGLIALSVSIGAYAATSFKLVVGGKATKLDVKVINKVNYVPLNEFAALMGQDVKMDTKTSTLIVTKKATPAPTPKPTPTPKPKSGVVPAEGKISPPIIFNYSVNSANGVKLTWKASNLTGKTIKYYTVKISTLNGVGDPSYDEITGESTFSQRYVGPLEAGEEFIFYDDFTYQGALHKIIIDQVVLEYMDGTKETVTYGYGTTDDSGL
jgi:hypothetical protein